MKNFFAAAAAAALLFANVATAIAQDNLQLTTQAFQELETTGKDGKKQKQTVPATKVVPGTDVTYVITYKNSSAVPASNVVINNAVPKELSYLSGSASGKGAKFEVSVDGGASFGALPGLKVAGADGKPRPAQAADVTNVRWTLAGAVAPGKDGTVSYKARLK